MQRTQRSPRVPPPVAPPSHQVNPTRAFTTQTHSPFHLKVSFWLGLGFPPTHFDVVPGQLLRRHGALEPLALPLPAEPKLIKIRVAERVLLKGRRATLLTLLRVNRARYRPQFVVFVFVVVIILLLLICPRGLSGATTTTTTTTTSSGWPRALGCLLPLGLSIARVGCAVAAQLAPDPPQQLPAAREDNGGVHDPGRLERAQQPILVIRQAVDVEHNLAACAAPAPLGLAGAAGPRSGICAVCLQPVDGGTLDQMGAKHAADLELMPLLPTASAVISVVQVARVEGCILPVIVLVHFHWVCTP
ncbi:hypothetical protein FJTKL_12095 [Diaporthe vaccinii]|uniref:Uncharacterized protein n=1 Tax=Diaporthe vaccinii TaxID=105482 RepID=A0ABR4EEW4_9PEZI